MSSIVQHILQILLDVKELSEADKSAILSTLKSMEKNLAITEFKLTRIEKEKKTLMILLEETIEELEKKRAGIEQANNDLVKALDDLKATQTQLIQSEKMASLGELTAGIAHEIQNPLNFVNNFSDVNTELIDELKIELGTGNTQQAIELANDIKDNEQKINHHGKRADAIVKGMLQHSRSNTGVKEPTDINALCDEYFRLSFH